MSRRRATTARPTHLAPFLEESWISCSLRSFAPYDDTSFTPSSCPLGLYDCWLLRHMSCLSTAFTFGYFGAARNRWKNCRSIATSATRSSHPGVSKTTRQRRPSRNTRSTTTWLISVQDNPRSTSSNERIGQSVIQDPYFGYGTSNNRSVWPCLGLNLSLTPPAPLVLTSSRRTSWWTATRS